MSLECIALSSVWFKVLSAIDLINRVLQARDVTLDVEIANLKSLLENLVHIRKSWDAIYAECKGIAENIGINATFKSDTQRDVRRKVAERSSEIFTQSPAHSPGYEFKTQLFYVLIDCVTANIRRKFKAAEKLNNRFCVLWKYSTTEDATIERQARALFEKYSDVINKSIALTSSRISEDTIDEIKDLKKIHFANISSSTLDPFGLLTKLHELHLEILFSNG